ncbi:MAG TPA: ABC transporter substrate-binding protein [Bacillota bacterium]|nr:ABC transporter substrate-binding protein [Bacillota bacterium]HOA14751.1 ABC transporter substrate-binding protein [Bacillota bacterium]
MKRALLIATIACLIAFMLVGNLFAAQVVKIGAILPLSGSAAATGTKIKYAIEVAQQIINEQFPNSDLPLAKTSGLPNLGGAQVEFVFADHQGNPELAKSEAERLIQNEKVVALIGCYQSSATKPASQEAERFGIPFVAGSSSSAALTERGLKWFFRIAPNDDMESEFFFQYLKYLNDNMNAGIKRVAVVYIDNEYGVHAAEMANKWAKEYAKHGFEIVAQVKYPAAVSNVDTEVQRIKAARPDAIFHASYIADTTLLVKKYKELNVVPKAVLAYCGGYQDPQFVINLGKDAEFFAGPNAISSTMFPKVPAAKFINDMYAPKAKVDIDGPTIEDFASAMVVADAINQAKSTDPAAILKVLKESTFSAPYFVLGKIKFNASGQNELSASVMTQVQGGKYEVVWPVEASTAKAVPSFPAWNQR